MSIDLSINSNSKSEITLPDGKVLRNFVAKLDYLSDRVEEHYERDRVLEDYGIRVVGSVDSSDQLPNPVAYDGLYGDAYTVGTGAPYSFYIFTRPLQGETDNRWLDLGELAIQGPQGEVGPQGPQGETGESSRWYVGQGQPYIEANEYSMYFDTNTANIFQKQTGQWVLVGNIKGNQGIQGPQGPKGDTGEQGPQGIQGENGVPGDAVNIVGILTSEPEMDPNTVPRDSAYVVQDGTGQWLYFITGLGTEASPLIWDRVAFENGTTVLVNGNPVQTFDADTKLSKPSGSQELGVVPFFPARSTTQGWLNVGESQYSAKANALARYIAITSVNGDVIPAGTIIVNTPTKIAHAANKKYVDDQVQAAKDASVEKSTLANYVYGTDNDGNAKMWYLDYVATAETIPRRGSSGVINVGHPTAANHATTKKYVDDSITNRVRIREYTYILPETDASLNIYRAMQKYPVAGDRKIVFDILPLDSTKPNAGVIFTTGSSSTVYRKIEVYMFGTSSTVVGYMRLTQVNGAVSYSNIQTSTTIKSSGGPTMVMMTGTPTEELIMD